MPSTCCVPGCNSNYKSSNEGNIAVFKFPSDEERAKKWIEAINRANFQPTKRTVVCVKHFDKSQVISEDSVIRPDGSVLTVTRSNLKLSNDAVPWNFADTQLTVPPLKKRKAPSEQIESAINRDEERFNQWCTEDEIAETSIKIDTVSNQLENDSTQENNVFDFDFWYGVCRICAKHNDNVIPIFKDAGFQYELAAKISKYFPFQISQDDGFPQNCCHECISLIVSWDDLIICSEKAVHKLNNMRQCVLNNGEESIPEHDREEKCSLKAGEGSVDFYKESDNNVHQKLSEDNNASEKELPESVNDNTVDTKNKDIKKSYGEEDLFCLKTADDHIATVYRKTDDTDERQLCLKNKKLYRSKEIRGLQAYKLHLPMKYISVNDHQYLRTKVFGFEPDSAPDGCGGVNALYFTCCICRKTMIQSDVINHSKSHYPLKISDSCQMCYIGLGSVDKFRNHLKKHTVLIDERYNELNKVEESVQVKNNKDVAKESYEDGMHSTKTDDEADNKFVEVFICEYCGMNYTSRKTFLQHIRKVHVSPFLCKFCRRRFTSENALKSHRCVLVVDKGPKNKVSWFNCKCKKIFIFEEQYLKHIESCEKAKVFACEECKRQFPDKSKLDLHVLLQHIRLKDLGHKTMTDWICEICGCHLSRLSAKKHYLTHSFMEKKFTCEKCDRKFSDKIALEKHAQTHSNLRPFSCEICKGTFKRKDHVKIHMKNKHKIFDNTKKFQCRKCKRHFTTNSYLIRHQRLHSQGVSYECAVCISRFPTEHSLKMHQTRTKHDSGGVTKSSVSLSTVDWVNKYRCNLCNQRYGSISSLRKHSQIHVKKNVDGEPEEANNHQDNNKDNSTQKVLEKIHQCTKCSKRYLSEFGLKLHLARTKHGPVKLKTKKKQKAVAQLSNTENNSRFKCNVCNENFCTLLSLKMHKIKCKHFTKCPSCDKRFALDFKLRNHLIKVHNRKDIDDVVEFTPAEIMPYECEVCHQKFAMNHNLVSHMQKKHPTIDDTTPISLIYIDSEVFNQKTADGETPVVFQCTDCWENFLTEDDFHNHTHNTTETDIVDVSVTTTTTIDISETIVSNVEELTPDVDNNGSLSNHVISPVKNG